MTREAMIRVGVVGVGRGGSFMRAAEPAGMELVAVCDTWQEGLKQCIDQTGVTGYTDFDRFLDHELDAVVLANYFHEHAPMAIKALDSGRHVLSECACCGTVGEGVALIDAVERNDRIYMLAENYPYMHYNQEMRRLYQTGKMGKFLYGECEYVHPDTAEAKLARSRGLMHWRNWIPATYYCTHSVAPVMFITDTRPVKVNAFVIPYDDDDPTLTMTVRRSDTAAVLMLEMDNGAYMKSLHGGLRGHGNYTRIHCNKGLMESCRSLKNGMMRVHRADFDREAGEPGETLYIPDFPEHHELATRTGHGGGDFFTNYHFSQAIRSGAQPYLDVYRGVTMSIVGILGWRSALDNSAPVAIPDFRDAASRTAFADDHWSPLPNHGDSNDKPPASVLGHLEPSGEAKALAAKIWGEDLR